ncbi:MAG: response regulator [Silicimonas sp.]|jgi:CheY-like chemotaxis protein|nr:response regulator [Silicimonas sp.]
MRQLAHEIEEQLTHLRRYARAMTGDRNHGDRIAEHALVSFLHDNQRLPEPMALRVLLFRALQDARTLLDTSRTGPRGKPAEASANERNREPAASRDALHLHAFENFTHEEIAAILRRPFQEIEGLIALAHQDVSNMMSRRVLVIEDDLPVAAELSTIVMDMGHSVIGAAATQGEALSMVRDEEPDVIVSDIQLADGGSGIRTVNAILRTYPLTPVVYVTGYPERLLTGKGPEPAFLIRKPYTADQVRSVLSQALFFS